MKTILNNILSISLLLVFSFSFGQAKKPSLLIVPSDNWCFQNGAFDIIDNQGTELKVPNYKKLSKLLKEKYSYSMDEIERLSNVLSGGYYSVISGEKTLKQYKKSCTEYIRQKHNVTMDSDSDSD